MRVSVPASEEAGSPTALNALADPVLRIVARHASKTSVYTDSFAVLPYERKSRTSLRGEKGFARNLHPIPKVCEIAAMKLLGHDLGCIRGGRRVFCAVSFSITAGNALLLTGPNGAGKSSLLRMIAGLIRPAEGSIALEGGDPELSLAEQSHYVGHVDPLKPALTVTENLAFWTRFLDGARHVDEAARVERGLEAVGLADLATLPAGYLSAGQRRRLSLARVLAVPRPIWLLDEPTTALDATSQERLQRVMHTHLSGGGLIIAATHGPLGLAMPEELRLGTSSASRADSRSARDVDAMDATQ